MVAWLDRIVRAAIGPLTGAVVAHTGAPVFVLADAALTSGVATDSTGTPRRSIQM